LRAAPALVLLGVLAGCGGRPPVDPTPPVVEPITLTCPSDVRVENVPANPQVVTFNAPAATGGVPPLTVTCTPGSGSSFQLGDTPVACSATDGVRNAVCSFKVTLVARIPVLSVTKFLAFGDSITAGENGTAGHLGVLFLDIPNSYPVVLQSLLTERYTTQTFVVDMSGARGEHAPEGAQRIGGTLDFFRPQALLLMEGVNDCANESPCSPSIIRDALRTDIQQAKARNIPVFLSTLLPIDGTAYRGRNYQWPTIGAVNDAIRSLAAAEGVTLVDNWEAFQGHAKAGDYLDEDGLHPSPAGNRVIAQTFLTAIAAKLEAASTATPLRRRR